jgi:hypothetical protein
MERNFDDIVEKMRELEFRLSQMENFHESFLKAVYHDGQINVRPFDGESGEFARLFRYEFAAFLSVHRTLRYYIIRKSGKISGTAEWRAQIDDSPVLDALHHLRDVDIHDGIPEQATTVRVQGIQTGKPSVTVEPLRLAADSLKQNRRFKNRDAALAYLQDRCIPDIARDGCAELARVLDEGRQNGFI